MKIDFRTSLDSYQAKQHEFAIIDVPRLQYLMVDGHGDPNTSVEFRDAIEALYPVAYKLKFASKSQLARGYVVMPLEGLWWSDDLRVFTSRRDKSQWDWTMMIMQPEWITKEMFGEAFDTVGKKKSPVSLGKVRLETLSEGRCVQTLHVGSYDSESEILSKMHDVFIPENHLELSQKHHEIYFNDFRKVAPEKLRTILRHPVQESGEAGRAR